MKLGEQDAIMPIAYGGAVLGGGGGGSIEEGLSLGRLAFQVGSPRVAHLDELDDQALLVTVAAVGAPSSPDQYIEAMDYVHALEMLLERTNSPVCGLISNENGGMASLNGWFQSAVTGLPVVDAPCNGRAHPTGLMGAMQLDTQPGYRSQQAAVGGNPALHRNVRLYAEGDLKPTARLIRRASVEAGGLVAVARNPVTVAYARENAAPGALQQAMKVGQALLQADGPRAGAEAVCEMLGGEVVCQSVITKLRLETREGFDIGTVVLESGHQLTFWNEYMTLEQGDQRLATFPDLIVTLSTAQPKAIGSAELERGQEVFVIQAPAQNIHLGGGMTQPDLYRPAEQAVGKDLIGYIFP